MQLIECPWCGPREETEFHYGGEAHVPYPEDPRSPDRRAVGALRVLPREPERSFRGTVEPQRRLPALVQRRTRHRHLPIPQRLPLGRAEADDIVNAPFRTRQGGRIDRDTSYTFTFDGRELTGHPGDTLGFGPAGERRSTRSPPASNSAGPAASPRRGPRTPAVSSRSRSRSPSRCCSPPPSSCSTASSPAASPARVGSPRSPIRRSTTPSTSTPTSSSSAPDRPVSPPR